MGMEDAKTGGEQEIKDLSGNERGKFLHHAYYLAFDLLSVLIELFLFGELVAHWDPLWTRSYCGVFLFFCVGIFLKQWDPAYLKGIDEFGNKFKLVSAFAVYIFGLMLGAFGLFSFATLFFDGIPPIWIAIPASFLFVFGYPVLFGIISRTRTATGQKSFGFRNKKAAGIISLLSRSISYIALFIMNIYMLSFVYYQLEKFRSHTIIPVWTYPIVIFITAFLILFFYLPARIHIFFQFPRDKGNYISFIITCIGLVIFAVTGIYFRIPF